MQKNVTLSSAVVPDGIVAISSRRGLPPDYIVTSDADNLFYAAKWHLPAHQVKSGCQRDNIIACRLQGHTPVYKTVGGRARRGYAHPGTFTFIPSGEYADYTIEGDGSFLELYVSPTLLKQFSEQHAISGGTSIRPLFTEGDPWLAGYFQMMESELELYRGPARPLDSVLLGQAQQLLLAHLLRCYSDISSPQLQALNSAKAGYALRPHVVKRVSEYIETHLASDIRLADLAQLAHLSERHFIRAFRAATGCTPYHFVLEKRLEACATLLRKPTLSIADIATMVGLKSQSYLAAKFNKHYGMTPSAYRLQYRA